MQDIHDPQIKARAAVATQLYKTASVMSAERLWANPDCGLKARAWPKTQASLKNLVKTGKALR